MKYLGVDYGDKKIGLAIADSETRVATPFQILINNNEFLREFKKIIEQEKIDKIVVGLPGGLLGLKSKQYQIVDKFINQLEKDIDLEIVKQDEKYTSQYAQKLLQGTKHKGKDDDVAAMLILQSYLDKTK